jgi:hypothetical protein
MKIKIIDSKFDMEPVKKLIITESAFGFIGDSGWRFMDIIGRSVTESVDRSIGYPIRILNHPVCDLINTSIRDWCRFNKV